MVGFIVAAPIGPIGILCINRTLSGGRRSGFISGLGAVTGDGFYAIVAAYSITIISSFLAEHQLWFRLVGGIFLSYLGISIFLGRTAARPVETDAGTLAGDYMSAVGLTMANPVTVVVFGALFAGLGLGLDRADLFAPAAMVAGVIAGSVSCWFILSGLVSAFRHRFEGSLLRAVNRVAGSAILAFAGMIFFSILR